MTLPDEIKKLEMIPPDTGCNFCCAQTLENPGSHDFRVIGRSLCYHDSQFGWEGMEASYCPQCGRKLATKHIGQAALGAAGEDVD